MVLERLDDAKLTGPECDGEPALEVRAAYLRCSKRWDSRILDRIGVGRTGSVYRARDMRAGVLSPSAWWPTKIVSDPRVATVFCGRRARRLPCRTRAWRRCARWGGSGTSVSGFRICTRQDVGGVDQRSSAQHAPCPRCRDPACRRSGRRACRCSHPWWDSPRQHRRNAKGHAKFLDFGLSVPISRLEDGQQVTVTGAGARPHDVA